MIFPIVGLPGPFTSWCRIAAHKLLEGTGHTADQNHFTGGLADIARQYLKTNADHLVFSVSRPDLEMTAALKSTGRPILFASSDPRRAVLHLIRGGNADHRTAIRILSGDCSCLVAFMGHEHLVTLTAHSARQDILGAVGVIAKTFQLDADPSLIRHVASETADLLTSMTDPDNGGTDPVQGLGETLSDGLGRSAEFILAGFQQFLARDHSVPIIVTKELFLAGDPPHDHVEAPLDMTGRPRFIAFGPYVHIPAGKWMLRFVVSFSEEAIGLPCIVDVGVSDIHGFQELTRTHVVVSTAGRMEVTLSFQLEDPLTPLQVRLATDKSVFDGKLAIGFAEFRLNTDRPDADLERLLPETV